MNGIDPESPEAVAMIGFEGDVKAWAARWEVDISDFGHWVEWKRVPGITSQTRLVYPHYANGRIQTFSARNILGAEVNKEGREVKSYNLPVILAGERQVFFNHEYSARADECMVVEGQADAITLAQWGISAVALAGTAWQDHQALLEKLVERHTGMYIGLDADEAGMTALIGRQQNWPLSKVFTPMTRVVRWPESEGPEGKVGKDANDWLKWGMGALGLLEYEGGAGGDGQAEAMVKAQSGKAREWLNVSLTLAEAMAGWAGELKGAKRDKAVTLVFGVITRMTKTDRAAYRQSLAGRLGLGIAEFNAILKAKAQEKGDGEDEALPIAETLGGCINGWLVEYIYDPVSDEAKLAYRDPDKRLGTANYLDIEGVRYTPRGVTNFIRDGGVLFASEIGTQKSTRELVGIIEMFINQHYLLENRHLSRIISYYVLLTWVYDAFNALPYLRAMGEAGSGKSELMRRVGYCCYRLMTASGANTAASFFRATETYRGTVFIDEADLHDGGDMSNDLVKFLNLGAMKGNPIWRLEEVMTEGGGKTYEVATFSTFCPKLIAMRKDFRDDAVGSRSLTIKLMPREPIELKAKGIRLYIDDEFREKARNIRNLLLRWRFQMWEPEIPVTEVYMDLDISSRLNQVTMPLKALAKDDPELQDEIVKFLRAYNQEMVLTRSMTIAARVVEALWSIHNQADLREKYVINTTDGQGEMMLIGDVAKVANGIIDGMNALAQDEEDEEGAKKRRRNSLTARGVGSLIRNELQLQVGERRGKGFPVYWDQLKLEALAKRYGVDTNIQIKMVELNESPANSAQAAKQSEIPF